MEESGQLDVLTLPLGKEPWLCIGWEIGLTAELVCPCVSEKAEKRNGFINVPIVI
jgi:hypothetical protein